MRYEKRAVFVSNSKISCSQWIGVMATVVVAGNGRSGASVSTPAGAPQTFTLSGSHGLRIVDNAV